MKTIIFIILLFTMVVSRTNFASDLITVDNYEEAVKLSSETNQKLFVMFTSDSCPHCHIAKDDFINNPQIFEQDIVCFVSFKDRKDLVKKFNIKSLPTMILLKRSTEIKRMEGYKDKNNFIKWYK